MLVYDIKDLSDDGDEFELPDGTLIRLKIEVDDAGALEHLQDFECYGKIEPVGHNRYPEMHGGSEEAVRPAGFDGAAFKIKIPRSYHYEGNVWWQPPGLEITGARWDRKTTMEEKDRIYQLLFWGFKQVGLQHVKSNGVVADESWIGGVDEFYPELIDDLLSELNVDLELEPCVL